MDRDASVEALRFVLADTYVLALKTQNAHWNLEGPNFIALHGIFETQYQELIAGIDELAERIRALGEYADGSMAVFLEKTRLEESDLLTEEIETLNILASSHQKLAVLLTEHVAILEQNQDVGTCDLFTSRILYHEKQAWLLKSHL